MYDPQDIVRAPIPYEFSRLQYRVSADALTRYCDRLRPGYADLARGWSADSNTEWMLRNYVALKLILGSTVLLGSLRYCTAHNVQVTLPYLGYYGIFNAARAWVLTLPHIPTGADAQILTLSHEKVQNIVVDAAKQLEPSFADWLGGLILSARANRELFSYRFPGGGPSSASEHALCAEEAIEVATVLAEMAQVHSQLLDTYLHKRYGHGSAMLGSDASLLQLAYLHRVVGSQIEILDEDDHQRISQVAIKNGRPWDLATMARPGLVDDFFGGWLTDEGSGVPGSYDPDGDVRLIFQFN